MYEVFDHVCAYVKPFIVWLLTVFRFILITCFLYRMPMCSKIYESKISYVYTYVCHPWRHNTVHLTLLSFHHLKKLRFLEHLGVLHGEKYTAKRIP